jgi:hypothetical protein
MSDMVWRRSDQWVGTEVEDSFVMVNIESGKYVSLNASANAVWKALESERCEDELCTVLTNEFEIEPEQCRRAVSSLLERMCALEIATPRQPNGGG